MIRPTWYTQMNRRERRTVAAKSRTFSPASPAALYELGLDHLRAERFLEAQVCCQQALAVDSDHADSLHLMGLLALQT